MSAPRKSQQQQAAEARARGLLRDRSRLGTAAFEALQMRERAQRSQRTRERTHAAVAARRAREQQNAGDQLQLDLEDPS